MLFHDFAHGFYLENKIYQFTAPGLKLLYNFFLEKGRFPSVQETCDTYVEVYYEDVIMEHDLDTSGYEDCQIEQIDLVATYLESKTLVVGKSYADVFVYVNFKS